MASESKFISHIKTWVIVLPIIMIFAAPFFSMEWVHSISKGEVESNIAVFGEESHASLITGVDRQFARLFISNGLYEKTLQKNHGGRDSSYGELSNNFIFNYFDRLWKMVYRAMYRMHIAWQWLLGGAILIFAFMYDGWQSRNIKKHSVATGNPLAIHLVLHSAFFLLGATVALFFLPIAITREAWGIGIAVMALCAWKLAESFQSTN